MIKATLLLTILFGMMNAQVYKTPSAATEDRVDDLLKRMTLEEKLAMLSGTGFATTPNERLGIPEIKMTDGPLGVRWGQSVAFPAASMLAATFDTSLAYDYGWAVGRETKAKGRNTILGPCVNINRTPQGGRNFESYGEDPFLASRMAVSYIRGVQSEGVIATTKHFAVNNQETERTTINVNVDKRALYEIYFPAFKAAVQEGHTESVMCAYNKLDGPYCSENKMLLNDVLKNEWKFDGFVMSDWGAVHSTLGAATYGLDLEMPGGDYLVTEKLLPLVKNGDVSVSIIDDKVRRMLRVMFRMGLFDGKPSDTPKANAPEQRAVALNVARSGIVLLKNDSKILPLKMNSYTSVAVLGPNAAVLRTGGGGSSMVDPANVESPLEGIKKLFGKNVSVQYAVGARLEGDVPPIDAQFFYLPGDTTGAHGLEARYFDNMNFQGEPALQRIDSTIDFQWNDGSPGAGIGKDNFSVRWKGRLKTDISGKYELTCASDDGMRVYLDGKIVLENWSDHAIESRTTPVDLTAGRYYDLTVEFYEHGGGAAATLGWIKPNENDLAEAVDLARRSDLVLIFAGNSQFQESEGFDRHSIDLPDNQIQLIREAARVNPNLVLVLNAGAQITPGPWLGDVKALVWAFFPGQEGTQAITDILSGKVNPSGKLPFTIAKKWEDYPSYGNFPGSDGQVNYAEGILVGYRYFDTKNIPAAFPFGFGLSYTTFSLSDLKVTPAGNNNYDIDVRVRNTGQVSGSEVIQIYVHDNKPEMMRPEKELKAFAKVFLNAGEEKVVTLHLDKRSFEYYNDTKNKWVQSAGGYTLFIGPSIDDLPLSAVVH